MIKYDLFMLANVKSRMQTIIVEVNSYLQIPLKKPSVLLYTGERPFSCLHCDMSFTTNGNMHRHMRIHQKTAATMNTTVISTACSNTPTNKFNTQVHYSTSDMYLGDYSFHHYICPLLPPSCYLPTTISTMIPAHYNLHHDTCTLERLEKYKIFR